MSLELLKSEPRASANKHTADLCTPNVLAESENAFQKTETMNIELAVPQR